MNDHQACIMHKAMISFIYSATIFDVFVIYTGFGWIKKEIVLPSSNIHIQSKTANASQIHLNYIHNSTKNGSISVSGVLYVFDICLSAFSSFARLFVLHNVKTLAYTQHLRKTEIKIWCGYFLRVRSLVRQSNSCSIFIFINEIERNAWKKEKNERCFSYTYHLVSYRIRIV